ncbi:unnamed protein product [Paramecium octaurelia]|uniref:Uncharacterized protein n=1 Tax=Paramecium octaurelia TaxID=43137 RepID=A0A8S1SZI3_PAROT|nr:unnamed protein product [Paramecium octaurelia]
MICPLVCDQNCINYLFEKGQIISIVSVVFAVTISWFLIWKHLNYFNFPYFQSKIIIILMMSPFYAVISILSLEIANLAQYFELIRDIYLAFLLFTFFYLMFSYMAYDEELDKITDEKVYETMIQNEEYIEHLWPFNHCSRKYYLTTESKAKYFTYRCKKFVLQYCIIKPVFTLFLIVSQPFHSKLISSLELASEIIIVLSESFSLYYLILFYVALKKPLSPYKPLLKFLIIKITLFFTFWQSLVLSVFKKQIGECFEPDDIHFTDERIISSIENTLVCLEMFIMTIACIFAFSYVEFEKDQNTKGTLKKAISDNWKAFKHDFRLIKPKKFGYTPKVHHIELKERLNLSYEVDIKFEKMNVKQEYL